LFVAPTRQCSVAAPRWGLRQSTVIEETRVSMQTPRRRPVALLTSLVCALAAMVTMMSASAAQADEVTIANRTQFLDTSGDIVHAHGGGIIQVGRYYYWFGENRNADSSFKSVTVYRSTDLKTWKFRNNALTQSSSPELASSNIERPKVMYNAATGKFVMWMHKETATDYVEARAAVAVSDTIDGDYTYQGSFRPLNQYMSRDITVFVDTDGAGYMISSANENRDLNVYRLTSDYTQVASLVKTWPGDVREAPAMFKRNGVYFMVTSGATYWNPNQQKYSTATSIAGPWSSWQNVGDASGFGSQTTAVLPIQGTETTSYLYLGDRWGPGFGAAYADSQYIWLPLRFPSNTSLAMDGYEKITVDTDTGVVAGVPASYVNLVARHSGKCADVNGASTANNAELLQWTCSSGNNQQITTRTASDGYVQLVLRHSGLCLDVANVSTADNAQVIQWACGNGTNQQWKLQDTGDGYVRISARHSGKCLDVAGASTANGARIKQNTCNVAATSQQWQRSTYVAPPTVTATTDPATPTGQNGWFTQAVNLIVTASDPAGIASTEYRIDGGPWRSYTQLTALQVGAITVDYRATGTAGNVSPIKTITVRSDPYKPTVDAVTDDATATVTLTGNDNHSGVATISYRVDDGGWLTYGGPVTVTGAGKHKVWYRAFDNAGNESATSSVKLQIP
jgi:hypothetical protein